MHPNSLPPSDRDEAPEAPAAPSAQSGERSVRPHNPAIRARLQAYRAETQITNKDLGTKIGVSSSVISQYLLAEGMRYTGLVDELETKIESFFSSMAIRETAAAEVQDTIATEIGDDVLAAINRAIKTESVIIISGPAGCGKTHMLGGFAAKHPSALLITIDELNGSVYGIEREVANQLPPKGAGDYARLFDFAVAKLKNSGRLLMVDNAHKLKTTGFSLIFDLADKTGIPVILNGNGMIEARIKGQTAMSRERNQQNTSRVFKHIQLAPKYTYDQVRQFTRLYLQSPSEKLIRLAHEVANAPGHLRSLKMHLRELDMYLTACGGQDHEAFRLAHSELITDVSLSD